MEKTPHQTNWIKMSGAGNCFWITHFSVSPLSPDYWIKKAQTLCKNNADGLVVLLPSKVCDFKWLFYNADGSSAEMCGNAACCVTDYIFKKKLLPADKKSLTLETLSQTVTGTLKKGLACIFIQKNRDIKGPFKVESNKKISYMFVNSSVPHAVIELSKWPKGRKSWEKQKTLSRDLRKNKKHHKDGMNVSFYCPQKKNIFSRKSSSNRLWARSFERGVEDFTPACGTGALAIAQVHHQYFPHLKSLFVDMPGGILEVGFHPDNKLSLISPVKWITQKQEKETK